MHNQRDFVFFRHHRYEFNEDGTMCNLKEVGPRFTLKMRWLQQGSFDTKFGEYEWFGKRGGIGLQEKRTQFNL